MTVAEAVPALDRLLEVITFRRRDRALAPIVRRATKALRTAFLRQGSAFVRRLDARLREAIAPGPWEADFDKAALETLGLFTEPLTALAEAALAAGIREALADVEAGIAFDLSNPRAVTYLKDYAADLVTGLNDVSKTQLRTLLTQAVDDGWSYGKTATAIRKEFAGFSRKRATVIAVQEAGEAYEHGNMAVAQELADTGLDMEKSWLPTGGACAIICAPNADQGWLPLAQAYKSGHERPLGHVRCVVGDTEILAPPVRAATERWYEGDFIIIHTTSGKKLTCTPNHPILTPSGWVAAHRLNEGGRVICAVLTERMSRFVVHQYQNMPTRIEQIARAFRRSEQVSAVPMPLTAEDFHGDGLGSEVAVVWTNGLLGNDILNAPDGEHRGQSYLLIPHITESSLPIEGTGFSLFPGHYPSLAGSMGRGNLGEPLGRKHLLPLQPLSLTLSPGDDAGLYDAAPNEISVYTKPVSQGILGLTRKVAGDDLCVGKRLAGAPCGHAGRLEPLADAGNGHIQLFSQRRCTPALSVFIDDVTRIERKWLKTHVYNLQTASGWYIANGIVTHNCRCAQLTRRKPKGD